MVRPMSTHEGIGVYTSTASPWAPCIVMQHAVLSFFDQWGLTSSTSRKVTRTVNSLSMSTPKKQVVRIMYGALKKKDFFPDEVCPLYFSKKYSLSKCKHIHRQVKCVHLVPEPGSRWHGHVVLGSEKKNPRRNFNTEIHRQMHRTNVVPKLAGRQSISFVARSKKFKLPLSCI